MNQLYGNTVAWRGQARGADGSPGVWSGVTEFFRRQPEFVFVGAVAGGVLLAWLTKNRLPAAKQKAERGNPWASSSQPAWHRPAARLGATEEQMEALVTPSARALAAGTAGATGAAYELDPTSITSG